MDESKAGQATEKPALPWICKCTFEWSAVALHRAIGSVRDATNAVLLR